MNAIAIDRPTSGIPWKLYIIVAGLLATLALYFLAWAYPTFPGDEGALVRFQSLRSGWLDETALWFANIGLLSVFMPVAGFLMACLILARRYADAAMIFTGLFVIAAGNGLKLLVDRPRPEYQISESLQSGLSFPSGHSLLAVIMGGMLIYLVGLWVKPLLLRRVIQAALFVVVIGMGASRVYLGVHWPSDVIGAYLFGAMALVGLVGFRNAVAIER